MPLPCLSLKGLNTFEISAIELDNAFVCLLDISTFFNVPTYILYIYIIYIFAVYTYKYIVIYIYMFNMFQFQGILWVSSYLQADYLQICRSHSLKMLAFSVSPFAQDTCLPSRPEGIMLQKKAGGNNNIAKKLKRKNSSSKFFKRKLSSKI